MELITVNLSGTIRREKLHGRDHVVVPLSLIVPGVLNGSKGPMYYSEAVVKQSTPLWNGQPIVVRHPTENGKPVSAKHPRILEKAVGVVLQSEYRDKLGAEAWLDVEKTNKADSRILTALEAGSTMEVSTGLGTDERVANGSFNGKSYTSEATNLHPDHLAILPDEKGACSLEDGCGLNVNSEGFTGIAEGLEFKNGLIVNEAGEDEYGSWTFNVELPSNTTLGKPFRTPKGPKKFSVYVKGPKGTLVKVNFGDPNLEIKRDDPAARKSFRARHGCDANPGPRWKAKYWSCRMWEAGTPVSKITNQIGEHPMPMSEKEKADVVNFIINTCECWSESDRETLNGFDDEKLTKLHSHVKDSKSNAVIANAAREGFKSKDGSTHIFDTKAGKFVSKAATKKTEPEGEAVVTANSEANKPKTDEEWLKEAPEGIRTVVQNAMDREERVKKELVAKIHKHIPSELKETIFTENSLMAKSEQELEALAKATEQKEVQTTARPAPSYIGAGGAGAAPTANAEEDNDILPLPSLSFAKKAE